MPKAIELSFHYLFAPDIVDTEYLAWPTNALQRFDLLSHLAGAAEALTEAAEGDWYLTLRAVTETVPITAYDTRTEVGARLWHWQKQPLLVNPPEVGFRLSVLGATDDHEDLPELAGTAADFLRFLPIVLLPKLYNGAVLRLDYLAHLRRQAKTGKRVGK